MDYKYIEQLLERYFLGETTVQEEQILKAFYAQGAQDMPSELSRYAALFVAMDEKEELGDDFDQRILEALNTQIVPMTSAGDRQEAKSAVKARTISLAERLRPLFGAAAMVAILLTLGNAINQSMKGDDAWVDADEYTATVPTVDNRVDVAYDQLKDSLTLAKDNLAPVAVGDSLLPTSLD